MDFSDMVPPPRIELGGDDKATIQQLNFEEVDLQHMEEWLWTIEAKVRSSCTTLMAKIDAGITDHNRFQKQIIQEMSINEWDKEHADNWQEAIQRRVIATRLYKENSALFSAIATSLKTSNAKHRQLINKIRTTCQQGNGAHALLVLSSATGHKKDKDTAEKLIDRDHWHIPKSILGGLDDFMSEFNRLADECDMDEHTYVKKLLKKLRASEHATLADLYMMFPKEWQSKERLVERIQERIDDALVERRLRTEIGEHERKPRHERGRQGREDAPMPPCSWCKQATGRDLYHRVEDCRRRKKEKTDATPGQKGGHPSPTKPKNEKMCWNDGNCKRTNCPFKHTAAVNEKSESANETEDAMNGIIRQLLTAHVGKKDDKIERCADSSHRLKDSESPAGSQTTPEERRRISVPEAPPGPRQGLETGLAVRRDDVRSTGLRTRPDERRPISGPEVPPGPRQGSEQEAAVQRDDVRLGNRRCPHPCDWGGHWAPIACNRPWLHTGRHDCLRSCERPANT